MKCLFVTTICSLLMFAAPVHGQEASGWVDPSPHARFVVQVDHDVFLEVLDWGGNGRPIVLLAGLGYTAHVFDDFAPDLVAFGRVIGITRRGFGTSTRTDSGYTVERLATDVLEVLDSLAIDRVVLIGHSIGGQELSYIATYHPERAVGLVYLDAYSYAYQPASGQGKEVTSLPPPQNQLPNPPRPTRADLRDFPTFRSWMLRVQGSAPPEAELRQRHPLTEAGIGPAQLSNAVSQAILAGTQRFEEISVPSLAIFAIPQARRPWQDDFPESRPAFEAAARHADSLREFHAAGFERGVPGARVLRIPDASHDVFISHADEVLREVGAFLLQLK